MIRYFEPTPRQFWVTPNDGAQATIALYAATQLPAALGGWR
jgi:hypothetical protein